MVDRGIAILDPRREHEVGDCSISSGFSRPWPTTRRPSHRQRIASSPKTGNLEAAVAFASFPLWAKKHALG
jgi:hypothetical protein